MESQNNLNNIFEGKDKLPIEIDEYKDEVKVKIKKHISKNKTISLEYHSILNLIHVLKGYLQMIGMDYGKKNDFINETYSILTELTNFIQNGNECKIIDNLEKYLSLNISFENEIADKIPDYKENKDINDYFQILILMIDQFKEKLIFTTSGILKYKKQFIKTSNLKNDLVKVGKLVEKYSSGKFGIIFSMQDKKETDYLIDYQIKSIYEDSIYIPTILIDIIRDLVLNSRKYSKIGSIIKVYIDQNEDYTTIQIIDNGIGIPKNEILKVFGFGNRGENIEKMGFGLGLTKAYYVINDKLGGEVFIKSKEGVGTKITLKIKTK